MGRVYPLGRYGCDQPYVEYSLRKCDVHSAFRRDPLGLLNPVPTGILVLQRKSNDSNNGTTQTPRRHC